MALNFDGRGSLLAGTVSPLLAVGPGRTSSLRCGRSNWTYGFVNGKIGLYEEAPRVCSRAGLRRISPPSTRRCGQCRRHSRANAVDFGEQNHDYGDADGAPWTDVVATFGRVPSLHGDQPIAPGAEAWSTYLHRASGAPRNILTWRAGGSVLIVGHGETITAAAHLFFGLTAPRRASAAFAAHYASVTRWEHQPLAWTQPDAGWRWTLLCHNDTARLTTP